MSSLPESADFGRDGGMSGKTAVSPGLVIDRRYHSEIAPGFDADTLDRLICVLNRP